MKLRGDTGAAACRGPVADARIGSELDATAAPMWPGVRTTYILVGLGFEPCVSVHGESEELLERGQRAEQHHDDAPALDSLNGTSEQVGRDAFKVLQDRKA